MMSRSAPACSFFEHWLTKTVLVAAWRETLEPDAADATSRQVGEYAGMAVLIIAANAILNLAADTET
jgi:hypothetical protein